MKRNNYLKLGLFCAAIFSLFLTSFCQAHDARPISITMNEQTAGDFVVKIAVPASLAVEKMPQLQLPAFCLSENASKTISANLAGTALVSFQHYRCQQSLSGEVVQLSFPRENPSLSSLMQIIFLNGDRYNTLLKPGSYQWKIPQVRVWYQVIGDFTRYGIEHIAIGFDHLLFVLLLFLLAKNTKQLVLIISGFTFAHSITLTAAAFQWLLLPSAVVEATIALSIMFLAHELLVKNTASWTMKYPILMSSAIGLVHGLGFASVLTELGFAASESIYALLFFNIGVEIGQLCFIALLLMLTKLITKAITNKLWQSFEHKLIYLVGSVGAFWFIERLSMF